MRDLIYSLDVVQHGNELVQKATLPADFAERVKRYKNEEVRFRSLCAYSLLIYAFEKEGIPLEPIIYVGNKKPDFQNIHFNVSHSGDIVAVMVSKEPCGIDVQMAEEAKDFEDVAKRVLSKDLYQEYLRSSSKPRYFAKAWSILEAKLKAEGTGIAVESLCLDNLDYPSQYVLDSKNRWYSISYSPKSDVTFTQIDKL